ncbi:MAG: DEAD/DEAH box helicase [Phycisphaerales bacterium]|nr:DEAD/DEAH box helicase [Phycisphaerales bacterium]
MSSDLNPVSNAFVPSPSTSNSNSFEAHLEPVATTTPKLATATKPTTPVTPTLTDTPTTPRVLIGTAGGPSAAELKFSALNLAAPILRALSDEKYETPTPIQAKAIPPAAEGRDLLGCAQTGTGKTAAFALPILHRLLTQAVDKTQRGHRAPRALILSPTRELAGQIGDSFAAYGRHTGLTHTTIYGGVSQFHQVRALDRGVDVLVATPGRLIDLMQQRLVDLSKVSIFVLDEADRMLDMGFIVPIRRIAAALPKARQTMLFSATMPREIVGLAESLLKDPVRVSVTPVASAAPLIEQFVHMIERSRKQALIEHLITDGKIHKALVFTRTKRGADVVTRRLNEAGITATAIHGNKAQNQRQRALDGFRAGRSRILVATDVAARGIDIDNISHVFNYDLPDEAEAYVHRIGRTGRAGATGIAISLCDGEERGLLRDIERLTGKRVPVAEPVKDLPERAHTPRTAAEDEGRRQSSHSHPRHPQGHGHPARGGHAGGTGGGRGGRPGGGAPHAGHRGSRGPAKATRAPGGSSGGHRNGGGHGHPLGAGGGGGRPLAGARTGMNHFRGKPRKGTGRPR